MRSQFAQCDGKKGRSIVEKIVQWINYSLSQKDEVRLGIGHRAYLTFLRTAIDIYFYVQSVTTPPGKVTIARMLVEIQPTKIGLEAISSEELKIQNLLQDFPASQSVNFGDRYGFDCCLANY